MEKACERGWRKIEKKFEGREKIRGARPDDLTVQRSHNNLSSP